MTSFIFPQEIWKKGTTGKPHEPDAEPSNLTSGCPLRCRNGPLCLCQGLDRFLVERLASGREPRGSSISREELDA
jgi:hypothetical protein